jgi:hypothetical protein
MSDDRGLRESFVSANTVRVPDPEPGAATVVRRYSEARAVVLHPDDYARLVEDSRLISSLGRLDPLPPPTPLERKVMAEVETPGAEGPVLEDYDALTTWLALGEEK